MPRETAPPIARKFSDAGSSRLGCSRRVGLSRSSIVHS
jgi:hypothetical protein